MATMSKPKVSGQGMVTIGSDEVTDWLKRQMPSDTFYTFERVRVNPTTGDLEARYTYDNQKPPKAPT